MFRLALALGRTVGELESQLSSRELSEWRAFYAIEPFGDDRLLDGFRGLMSITVNANSTGERVAPTDFLKGWRPAPAVGEDDLEGLAAFLERRAVDSDA